MNESLRQKQARVRELREKALRNKGSVVAPNTPNRSTETDEPVTAPVTPDFEPQVVTIRGSDAASAADLLVPSVSPDSHHTGLAPARERTAEQAMTINEESGSVTSKSKSSALKERLRKQEAQLAMLRRRSTLRQSTVETHGTSSGATPPPEQLTSINDRTKELLMMTARKKKEVAGRKRQFSNMTLQMETLKAIETATQRLETLT
mmetsp:Transcript_32865/g.68507  ORF Transcript_32865/g.68507 Transcript_32865/m.68507 type:complete len:206 (-) Transcript_32865:260-877(-)